MEIIWIGALTLVCSTVFVITRLTISVKQLRAERDDLRGEKFVLEGELSRERNWKKMYLNIVEGITPDATTAALREVYLERERQDEKWGDQSGQHPFEWVCILLEEAGELAEAVNETYFSTNYTKPERGGLDAIRREAVHVAAVAVAMAEYLPDHMHGRLGSDLLKRKA